MRRCKITGKRIHASVTEARRYARNRYVKVKSCEHCMVRCADGLCRPGYHVTRHT